MKLLKIIKSLFTRKSSLKVFVKGKYVDASDDFKKMHEETMKRLERRH